MGERFQIVFLKNNMTNLDNKISFISGFGLTSLWAMPIMELAMALLLGLVGGVGGVVGKWIVYKTGWFKRDE